MNTRIQQLPILIANQIAAGEVVERPASIVKELLENSLDAACKSIVITLKQGGTSLIKIQDDGVGIVKEDLPLALSRHATSKIYTLGDLEHIASLGFRGEALASIAAIAHVNLISATTDQSAWQIAATDEGELTKVLPAAHPRGTTITVQDIFYNTPVRRKFLRSLKTEWQYIDDIVKRVALSHFHVAVQLTHNDKIIYNLSRAETASARTKRVEKLCGKRFVQDCLEFTVEVEGLHLSGWMTKPEASRPHSDMQYFFLNGRMIKDKLINHAIRQAAQELIPEGRYLAYLLYLTCDPAIVDVNVHPTKHEVRFHDNRLIHDFVLRSLRKQLLMQSKNSMLVKSSYIYQVPDMALQPAFAVQETKRPYQTVAALKKEMGHARFGNIIARVKQQYLLTELDQSLLLIDLQKAFAIVFSQQLQQSSLDYPLVTQPLLIPLTVKLNDQAIERLQAIEQWQAWAIDWQQQGPDTIIIRHLPSMLKGIDLEKLFLSLSSIKNPAHFISQMASQQMAKQADMAQISQLLSHLQTLEQQGVDIRMIYRCIELQLPDYEFQNH